MPRSSRRLNNNWWRHVRPFENNGEVRYGSPLRNCRSHDRLDGHQRARHYEAGTVHSRPLEASVNSQAPAHPGTLEAQQQPKQSRAKYPSLTEVQILGWCDDFLARTGVWPTTKSGAVPAAPGENWNAVDAALRSGHRGLPGGSSIAKLLAARRGSRNRKQLPALTEADIVALADIHHKKTRKWPTRHSGRVRGSTVPGETWATLNDALVTGLRGLPGGSSLAQVLEAHRGVRNRKNLPRLTVQVILLWAEAHYMRHGRYPSENAGPVEGASGETWNNISAALREGTRSLPGGSSLFKLLCKHGRVCGPGHGR
jgi:hypothetical protein